MTYLVFTPEESPSPFGALPSVAGIPIFNQPVGLLGSLSLDASLCT